MSQPQQAAVQLDDAESAIANLHKIMDALETTVKEETARVGAGRLQQATELADTKADLARSYVAETARLRAVTPAASRTLPEALETLRKRHATFQAMLQKNLTVLATAHAVSEGIIRGVSSEMTRKQAPSTYGASGRANAPSPKASQPIAVSKSL